MQSERKNKVLLGSVFVLMSACLWGVSGATNQYLFHTVGVTPEWVISTRMFFTGLLFLAVLQIKKGNILQIMQDREDRKQIFIFSFLGMLFIQYGYLAAIAYSNAATATVLQYTSPILIVVYLALRQRKLPTAPECIAVIGAVAGTFLLATHGDFHSLQISPKALFWGLLSAVAMAFYSIYPRRLMERYDTMVLIGWSMFLAGGSMNVIHPFWQWQGNWDTTGILCLAFVIFFGTVIPYLLFLDGIKYIGAMRGNLFASMEPVSSAIVSVLWLKVQLEWIDYVGFLCIILTVLLLSFVKPKETTE